MSDSATIGIVLVNYNGRRFLNDCIRGLSAGLRPGDEIVVVDNASADGSIEMLRDEFPSTTVLDQSVNLGVAAGNNLGIRHVLASGHDYVLLLNYDTRPGADLVTTLRSAASPSTLVSANTTVWGDRTRSNSHAGSFDWWLGRLRELFLGAHVSQWPEGVQEVDIADTCCLLVPRAVFDAVGLMDEAYFLYYDDTDFVVRAREAGFQCLFHPAATVEHFERGASGPGDVSPLSVYYTSRNRLYFMRKHERSRAKHGVFIAYFALSRLAYACWWIVTGRSMLVRSTRRGVADYLHGRMGAATNLARSTAGQA